MMCGENWKQAQVIIQTANIGVWKRWHSKRAGRKGFTQTKGGN